MWLHQCDICRHGEWQTGGAGVSVREAGRQRVWHEVTLWWLFTPRDGFQLLLLRPFHVYDICTCVALLTGGVSLLRHFAQNSCCLSESSLRTLKRTWHWVLKTRSPHAHQKNPTGRWYECCINVMHKIETPDEGGRLTLKMTISTSHKKIDFCQPSSYHHF